MSLKELKFIWILLPITLFSLIFFFQFIYFKIQFSKDRAIFGFKTDLRELDVRHVKGLYIYESPNHYKLVDNKGIESLLNGTNIGTEYSNIVLVNKVKAVYGEGFKIVGINGIKDKIPVIEDGNNLIYFDSKAISFLFQISEPSLTDLIGLSKTFSQDVVDESKKMNYLEKFGISEDDLFKSAQFNYIRHALNWFELYFKRSKWSINNTDLLKYIFEKNLTTSSTEIELRDFKIESRWVFFTILSYFLLATQASLFASWLFKLVDE